MDSNEVQNQVEERPLNLKSKLDGPILDLEKFYRSLLFAELSMIAYNDDQEVRDAAKQIGFTETTLYDNDGSQAYRFENEHDCVIACRGTEPNEWNDIKADANAISAVSETVGRVHSGFKKEVDDLWPMLEKELQSNEKPVYFTGHSLGGAMATICAGRCKLSHIKSVPQEVQTFGSPRVGNKRYVNHVDITYYRWVHNNDIVTQVPPRWFGYRHTGTEVYIDRKGHINEVGGWNRTRDRLKGFLGGLLKFQIDQFSDHSIHGYINAICRKLNEEGADLKLN